MFRDIWFFLVLFALFLQSWSLLVALAFRVSL